MTRALSILLLLSIACSGKSGANYSADEQPPPVERVVDPSPPAMHHSNPERTNSITGGSLAFPMSVAHRIQKGDREDFLLSLMTASRLYYIVHRLDYYVLHALNLSTLTEDWSQVLSSDGSEVHFGLAFADSTVFVNRTRSMIALDASTGDVLWKTDYSSSFNVLGEDKFRVWAFRASPVVTNGRIYQHFLNYYNTDTVGIWDQKDGSTIHIRPMEEGSGLHVAVGGNLIFMPDECLGFRALDIEANESLWRSSNDCHGSGPPGPWLDTRLLVTDSAVAARDGRSPTSNETRWFDFTGKELPQLASVVAHTVIGNTAVGLVGSDGAKALQAFDLTTGLVRWTATLEPSKWYFDPIGVNDSVVVVDEYGTVSVYNLQTGVKLDSAAGQSDTTTSFRDDSYSGDFATPVTALCSNGNMLAVTSPREIVIFK